MVSMCRVMCYFKVCTDNVPNVLGKWKDTEVNNLWLYMSGEYFIDFIQSDWVNKFSLVKSACQFERSFNKSERPHLVLQTMGFTICCCACPENAPSLLREMGTHWG